MKPALSKVVVTAALFLIAVAAQAQTATCTNYTHCAIGHDEVHLLQAIYPVEVSHSYPVAVNDSARSKDFTRDTKSVRSANQYGFHDMENGSYTANPDCTGNAQINFPTPPHGTSGAVITLMFVMEMEDARFTPL